MKFRFNCYVLPIFLLICCIEVKAQSNFQKGLIVLNGGDTIRGWIDYRNRQVNPENISFKKDLAENTSVNYQVSDLRYVEITNFDVYQRAVVTKDMRSVNVSRLEENRNDIMVTDTVLLRALVKGKLLNLFELVDMKDHYYIQEKDGPYQELIYKVYSESSNSEYAAINTFRDQLRKYAADLVDEGKFTRQLERAGYKEEDLKSLVLKINGGPSTNTIGVIEQPKGSLIRFFAGGGMSYANLKFKDENRDVSGVDVTGSIKPSFQAGVDFLSQRNLQNFVFRVQLAYYTASLKGKGVREYNSAGFTEDVTYTIRQNTFSPSLGVLHIFYQNKRNRLYGGIEGAYNFSTYPENKYVTYNQLSNFEKVQEDFIDFNKNWIAIQLKAGFIVNNFIDISASGNVLGNYSNLSRQSTYVLSASYRF